MRIVVSIIILLIIAFLTVIFLGAVLSSDFEKTERQSFSIPVKTAWDFISQVDNYPQFREEYYSVQIIDKRKGFPFRWQAFMTDGKLAVYQINNYVPQKHLSYQLIRSNNEMTGNWDFYFFGDSTNCTIEITETSRMGNPIEKVYWYFTDRGKRIDREFELIEGLEK